MKCKFLITIFLTTFVSLINLNGQCDSSQDDLELVTVTGGPTGNVTVTANTTLSYTIGVFGSLIIEVPINTTSTTISGASSTGLSFVQFFNSENLGLAVGKKYALFNSSNTINPSTLFPAGVPVEIGIITTVPSSNIDASSIVLTDLLPPINNAGTYFYYKTAIQVCNSNNFNDNLIEIAPNAALPITLSAFTATKMGRDADLRWNTSSELNSSHFKIERSNDGRNWDYVHSVKAVGQSSTLQEYHYSDVEAIKYSNNDGQLYYRLKMTDIDGSHEYSDIRNVVFAKDTKRFMAYPNPTVQELTIDLQGHTVDQNTKISVFDITGKLVLVANPQTSTYILDLKSEGLRSGVYSVVLMQDHELVDQVLVSLID